MRTSATDLVGGHLPKILVLGRNLLTRCISTWSWDQSLCDTTWSHVSQDTRNHELSINNICITSQKYVQKSYPCGPPRLQCTLVWFLSICCCRLAGIKDIQLLFLFYFLFFLIYTSLFKEDMILTFFWLGCDIQWPCKLNWEVLVTSSLWTNSYVKMYDTSFCLASS